MDDVLTAARVAETADLVKTTLTMSGDMLLDKVIAKLAANRLVAKENTQKLRKITTQLTIRTTIDNVNVSRSSSPKTRVPTTQSQRRVTFADDSCQRAKQQHLPRGRFISILKKVEVLIV